MLNKNIFAYFLIAIMVFGCASNDSSELLSESKEVVVFKTVKSESICQIDVPDYFNEMNDINDKALIQYGYIEKPEDKVNEVIIEDEVYAIVLVNYKNELAKVYGDSVKIEILDFNFMCEQNLKFILDDLSVVHEKPIVQEQNGLKSVHNEFYGRRDEYLVYYQFGIFETEIGFYQVLTWCMQDHLTKHKEEMYKVTSSFKEL
jgi:hypothetical protein